MGPSGPVGGLGQCANDWSSQVSTLGSSCCDINDMQYCRLATCSMNKEQADHALLPIMNCVDICIATSVFKGIPLTPCPCCSWIFASNVSFDALKDPLPNFIKFPAYFPINQKLPYMRFLASTCVDRPPFALFFHTSWCLVAIFFQQDSKRIICESS